jgi:phage baseplate assembly protein W
MSGMRALDFPFRLEGRGEFAITFNYARLVRSQVIDAVMTNLGERVMRPRYGCDFQAALFDPSDELVRRDAASSIRARLEQLVPRAIVRNVTVEVPDITTQTVFSAAEPGMVIITILYRPSLYDTDTTLAVPVASEFIARQAAIQRGQVNA